MLRISDRPLGFKIIGETLFGYTAEFKYPVLKKHTHDWRNQPIEFESIVDYKWKEMNFLSPKELADYYWSFGGYIHCSDADYKIVEPYKKNRD